MKRLLTFCLTMVAFLCLVACNKTTAKKTTKPSDSASSSTTKEQAKEEILLWVAEETIEFTTTKVNEFLAANPTFGFTVKISPMGEGEAATQMITDVEAGADVYCFAQDQLARLVQAGALAAIGGDYKTNAIANNDAGSIAAASMGGYLYAYPLTSDNGYFLFYDKSIVKNPSSLDAILTDCATAGKKFYMDNQSGWYDVAFFFALGCTYSNTYDEEANITAVNCDFDSANGVKALRALIDMSNHEGFQRSNSFAANFNPDGGTAAACISGTWDAETIKGYLGANYGVAKLPTFKVGTETYQMSSFAGFKLVGVNPTQTTNKLVASHKLAVYLTSEAVQLARFEAKGWGPSNKNAQQNPKVLANEALAALAAQSPYSIPQGIYPSSYWSIMEALGTDINTKVITKNATDAELKAKLEQVVAVLKAEVKK